MILAQQVMINFKSTYYILNENNIIINIVLNCGSFTRFCSEDEN